MTRPDKAIVTILFVLSCLIVLQKQCCAASWLFVTEIKLIKYYIDTDSIKVNKNKSTIKAWLRFMRSDREDKIILTLFNYKEHYFQFLQLTTYYPDGKSKTTDHPDQITYIIPDSAIESLFNKLLEITGLANR